MAGFKDRKVSKSRVQINYNLVDLFDIAFKNKSKDIRSQLRPFISDQTVKFSFGQEIVRKIRERTSEQGIDVNGRPFKKYSEAYIESDIFQINKDTEKPNLKLTGDMMASIQSNAKITGRVVTIEISDSLNVLKAFNHITGDTVAKRDFFGLKDNQAADILKKIVLDAKKDNILGSINILSSDLRANINVTNTQTTREGTTRRIQSTTAGENEVN
jgi:hypothetical protein